MSYAESITTLLNTDSTLTTLAAGGIRYYSNLGRKGLERIQTSDAYDKTTGLLKPLVIVIETDQQADGQIVGTNTSFIVPVYTWIYDRGDNGYATIERIFNRMYSVLHLAQIPNAIQVLYRTVARDKREPDLKDAAYYRAIWNVHGFLSQ